MSGTEKRLDRRRIDHAFMLENQPAITGLPVPVYFSLDASSKLGRKLTGPTNSRRNVDWLE